MPRHNHLLRAGFLGGLVLAQAHATVGTQPDHSPQADHVKISNPTDRFQSKRTMLLEPFSIIVVDGNGPVALLGLEMCLTASDTESALLIQNLWSLIYSRIFENLYSLAPLLQETGYKPSIPSFEQRLHHLLNGFLGHNMIQKITIKKAYLKILKPHKH